VASSIQSFCVEQEILKINFVSREILKTIFLWRQQSRLQFHVVSCPDPFLTGGAYRLETISAPSERWAINQTLSDEFFFGTSLDLENISCSLSHVHPIIKLNFKCEVHMRNMKRFVSCNEESLTLLCGKDKSFKDYLDDEVRRIL